MKYSQNIFSHQVKCYANIDTLLVFVRSFKTLFFSNEQISLRIYQNLSSRLCWVNTKEEALYSYPLGRYWDDDTEIYEKSESLRGRL